MFVLLQFLHANPLVWASIKEQVVDLIQTHEPDTIGTRHYDAWVERGNDNPEHYCIQSRASYRNLGVLYSVPESYVSVVCSWVAADMPTLTQTMFAPGDVREPLLVMLREVVRVAKIDSLLM